MQRCESCGIYKNELTLFGKGVVFLYCKSCLEKERKSHDVQKRKGRPTNPHKMTRMGLRRVEWVGQ